MQMNRILNYLSSMHEDKEFQVMIVELLENIFQEKKKKNPTLIARTNYCDSC